MSFCSAPWPRPAPPEGCCAGTKLSAHANHARAPTMPVPTRPQNRSTVYPPLTSAERANISFGERLKEPAGAYPPQGKAVKPGHRRPLEPEGSGEGAADWTGGPPETERTE